VLEETDYCYRVRALGYDVRYEPAAAVRHLHALTGGCRAIADGDADYWLFRNTALFWWKHREPATVPLLVGSSAARAALRAARSRAGVRGWARALRGLADGLRAAAAGRG
jgi:GT2 family glycosyltransferase